MSGIDERLHPAVTHPAELLAAERRLAGRINDWAINHLAAVFGAVWTVWVFFVAPLLAQLAPHWAQDRFSYYSQSWVQLFALPLFVFVGNRLQRSTDAQSAAQHEALTHIATVVDEIKASTQREGDRN